ncbi:hypothetical protein MRB53_007775 [Persea americana]|uniref:Uncharacterized protein n=1 Tax=Persea americana TaxID=3435 RepID=A0ACC2MJY0_PERAE|nr:hypothetical protein MRB53_007775 [Persea americana]
MGLRPRFSCPLPSIYSVCKCNRFLPYRVQTVWNTCKERTSDDVVPEEGNTELGKPANELEQNTLSNRISTEEHVQGSSAKQKAARCIENSSCKDVREEGEIKVHSNAKAEPSQQEMMAAISDMLAQADFDEERTTTDDDVCENEEHDKSKEQEDFLPEKDRTEVNKALKEKDHDTQGNIISTEKHVRGSASKKKAALDKNNLA